MRQLSAVTVFCVVAFGLAGRPSTGLCQARPRAPSPAAPVGPSLEETIRWLVTEGAALQDVYTVSLDSTIPPRTWLSQTATASEVGWCTIRYQVTGHSNDPYVDTRLNGFAVLHLNRIDVPRMRVEQSTTLDPPIWEVFVPVMSPPGSRNDRVRVKLSFPDQQSAERVQRAVAHAARLCGAQGSPF